MIVFTKERTGIVKTIQFLLSEVSVEYKRYRINERVIDDLKKRSTIGLLFYLVITGVIFFTGNYYQRHQSFSVLFLSSIVGICLFRALHLLVMKKSPNQLQEIHYAVFVGSVVLTALFWGLGFAKFMVQDGEHSAKLLMGLCTAGLASGGVVAFIPERRLAIVFNVCMLLPAVGFMLLYGTNLSLAVSVLLYSVYLVLITFRGSTEYWDAFENEFLLMKKSKALEKISQVDVLTELYNRRYFDEMFDHEWKVARRANTPLTLIICDIDFFKQVNDKHGHLAGDEYLKKTAELLTSVFKRDTDIVARFGGEEFVILLPGTEPESVYDMAEDFRAKLASSQVDYNGQKLKTTISLGMAHCVPTRNMQAQSLLANADNALYRAKKEGRNRVRII